MSGPVARLRFSTGCDELGGTYEGRNEESAAPELMEGRAQPHATDLDRTTQHDGEPTMKQRILGLTAIGLLGLLGSTAASALENGFYLGVLGAQGKMDIDKNDLLEGPTATSFAASIDDTDTAFGFFAGGQFGRWIAVETQIMDLGKYSAASSVVLPNYFASTPRGLDVHSKVAIEAAAVTLSGILTIPIGEQVAVGLRAGFAVTAAETTYEVIARRGNSVYYSESGDNDAEASDLTATFGISVEWDPTPHFGMRLEYQRINDVGSEDDDYDGFEFDDEAEHSGSDVDLISLNLIGRF
jgi:hypothetical protein